MKKHMIFNKKDEIMSGKKRVKRVSAYGNLDEVVLFLWEANFQGD